jgi:hypothetical protein
MIIITITNIALGLTTQFFGESCHGKYQILSTAFNIILLIYGLFRKILRINTFTNWIGVSLLGRALLLMSIGRRK